VLAILGERADHVQGTAKGRGWCWTMTMVLRRSAKKSTSSRAVLAGPS